jgi:glutamyl-tRNA reductase
MTKQRREKAKLIRSKIRKVTETTNTNKIQRIIKEHFENLYSSKLENLEEMNRFLDIYNQPKVNQEDINHLSRSVAGRGTRREADRMCFDNEAGGREGKAEIKT